MASSGREKNTLIIIYLGLGKLARPSWHVWNVKTVQPSDIAVGSKLKALIVAKLLQISNFGGCGDWGKNIEFFGVATASIQKKNRCKFVTIFFRKQCREN